MKAPSAWAKPAWPSASPSTCTRALLLENAAENPFLPRFYHDPKRHALATQLFFLFQRSDQMRDLAQSDLFHHATVTDFLLDKDLLFARLNLDDDEFRLYQKIYDELQPKAPMPDLVIYLQAVGHTAGARARARHRLRADHLARTTCSRLADSYARYFYSYDAAPLFIVNCEHLNFVHSDADFALLMQQIGAHARRARIFQPGRVKFAP